jgi:hypothetical protein
MFSIRLRSELGTSSRRIAVRVEEGAGNNDTAREAGSIDPLELDNVARASFPLSTVTVATACACPAANNFSPGE